MVTYGVFATLTITLTFTSCKKEDDPITPTNPPATSSIYSLPITDGSYWINIHELTDSAGNVTATGALDSVYVDGDSVIGAYTYKKIRTVVLAGNVYGFTVPLQLLRDSSGYLVSPDGSFIEHDNFTDTLSYSDLSGMVDAWFFMKHQDSMVTVPAGTFPTIDYEGHMYATDTNYIHPRPRYTHLLYADGIGQILHRQYYYTAPGYIQRRLVRYHIQ